MSSVDKVAKYATVDKSLGGLDYRRIAEKMTADGDKMNHANARNIFLNAMGTIASKVCQEYDISLSNDSIQEIARSPQFQVAVSQVLHRMNDTKDD